MAVLCSCSTPSEPWPTTKVAKVEGQATVTAGLGGNVWAFLYEPGQGPPGPPAVPDFLTAVSAERLSQGDTHFVFGSVAPNPYRLWGFLDVNQNFDPTIDVLAQPGAGDRVPDAGVELQVEPGADLMTTLAPTVLVPDEPPGFRLQGDDTDVPLDGSATNPVTLTLVSDAAGHLDPMRTAFHVGLVDANGDGRPDDANGDGIPDLSLQLFLHWLPLPGEDSVGGEVIVPLVFDPSPFITALQGQLGIDVVVTTMQGTVVDQAERLLTPPNKPAQLTTVGSAPTGNYELIALTASGQFWRLPNDLKGEEAAQGVRFHFDRAGP